MKIPIDFTPERDRAFLICTVRIPPKNLPLPIKFVVDTGSPETFIDEVDVLRFRIFAKSYPHSNDILMAGTKVGLFKLGKVSMNFRNDRDIVEMTDFGSLKVAESAWTRPEAVSTGTSILGMNFLLETQLHLFVDPSREMAYLSDGK